ncbi:MAG TPA: S41 family peptidase [Candidatus Limnocylindria bacterium]|nr:S41 family peptidase [Candidatus Limnocylindria bacterium]
MKHGLRNLFLALALALVIAAPQPGLARQSGTRGRDTVTITREEYDRLKQYELLDEVRQYIDSYYYQVPDDQALMDGAIQGLLGGLGDAYSFYYPEETWRKMQEDDEGKYAGIGVQMLGDPDNGSVTITRVFRDTPAQEAGLRKGDVFYKVEDIEVTTATLTDAVNTMRGVPGERVHVEVVRNGEVIAFDLIKANIVVNRVDYRMLDDGVGYILLYEFAGGSSEAVVEAFNALKAQGMRSLILDLRDNPGGWVRDAEEIGDFLMDDKLLYYIEDRSGNRQDYRTDPGLDPTPVILLVNDHSASASEILAAGLQDHKRATIMGVNTFGKGVIQYVIALSDGKTGFQLTYAQYFSPLGRKVHGEGIAPDIEVEMPEELLTHLFEVGDLADPQLAAAYEEAKKQ